MTPDALAAAVAAVPRQHYTHHPVHGSPPQTTAQAAIERDILRAAGEADLTGKHILEIGTGTGYTGALLAELVGPTGKVVSVDIDPALVTRARALHAERLCPVEVVFGDGHDGVPDLAPYDVVMGWCSPTHIPGAWLKQVRPGGVISSPVYIAPVARAIGHLRAVVTQDETPAGVQIGTAMYVDMGQVVNEHLGVPIFYNDAMDDGGAYVSVAWRGQIEGHEAAATLSMLTSPGHREKYPLGNDEAQTAIAWRDARAYLAARAHAEKAVSLTTWGSGGPGYVSGVGFSSADNAAVLTVDGEVLANRQDSPALVKLRDHLGDWEAAGRPDLERLAVVIEQDGGGWHVRATWRASRPADAGGSEAGS
ncbi:methyltransferase domain-containing protein [Streptosporangium sp. NPDC048047]|uniref:methyltransferase domain-containing protein n=1 Tax=Streptosporangium sp. NPDC048047 TaxID=3155748 RepID=UPI0034337BDF